MRNVPTAITTGLTNKLAMFWLVKIQGSGGNTYYWPTQRLNFTSQALILTETAGGSALTYDAGMIAKKIEDRTIAGIGSMDTGGDIYEGGGVGFIADLDLTILNQERFDSTINTNSVNLENRQIDVFVGFIPAGASPTVVIEDDMVLEWSGIIEDVLDFDYSEFILRCVDGSFKQYLEIPQNVINENDFPYAPVESLGKSLPLLYGDFTEADINLARDLNTISPAPGIQTNKLTHEFYVAGHAIHTLGDAYLFADEPDTYGKLLTAPVTSTNGASGAFIDWDSVVVQDIAVSYFTQLRSVDTTGMELGIDDSIVTYATGNYFNGYTIDFGSGFGVLTNSIAEDPTVGLGEIQIHIRFGPSVPSGDLGIYRRDKGSLETVGSFTGADADTRATFNIPSLSSPNLTWAGVSGMLCYIGVFADIRHICVEIYVKPNKLLDVRTGRIPLIRRPSFKFNFRIR